MTEAANASDEPADVQETDVLLNRRSFQDVHLMTLVNVVNSVERGSPEGIMGVTLSVGGTLISGSMIPYWQWASDTAEFIRQSVSNTGSVDDLFASWASTDQARRSEESDPDSAQAEPPHFIHLTGTRFFTNGTIIPGSTGALWRGSLAAVDGWVFGIIGAPSS